MHAEGQDIQNLRGFYPLLVVLGLESLDRIEPEDVFDILAYHSVEYEFE